MLGHGPLLRQCLLDVDLKSLVVSDKGHLQVCRVSGALGTDSDFPMWHLYPIVEAGSPRRGSPPADLIECALVLGQGFGERIIVI
jgi:hypothetical protein